MVIYSLYLKGVICLNTKFRKRIAAAAAVAAIALQMMSGAAYAACDSIPVSYASVAEVTAAAKPAVSERTGLEVGQTIQGFTVKEIRPYAPLQAEMILLEHKKTGAQFLFIANDDNDCNFTLAFHTVAENEHGTPHVFEHATLAGSDKYPAEAFFQIMTQTYCSFINAMTLPTATIYPISSLSEDQLLKYADYYTDACFHPMILKNEDIYKQEAWRYRLDKKDGELTVEGTVYSEMLSAGDINYAADTSNYRTAFPGSTVSNDYGGTPDHITDLTYEEVRDYHEKYYHPSNCTAVLYGDIKNFESFAELLNKEFSKYNKKTFDFTDKDYKPLKKAASSYTASPASKDDDTAGQTIVHRDYILRDISSDDLMKMELLSVTLNDENSPLITSIRKVYPQASISAKISLDGPEKMLNITVNGVDKKDGEKIKSLIDSSLEKMAKDGIRQKTIEKISHILKANNLLTGEGSTKGVMAAANIAYAYCCTDDIWFYTDVNGDLDRIVEYNENGDFKRLLKKYVKNNKLRVLTVTYPEKGLLEKTEKAREKKLEQIKASMTDAELDQLVKDTKEFDSRIGADDETIAKIVSEVKGVSLKNLPENVKKYNVSDTTDSRNVRTLSVDADISGIGFVDAYLDISDLTVDEAMWAQLYLDLMFSADTAKHKAADIADSRSVSLINYSAGINTITSKDEKSFTPYIAFGWTVLNEDMEKSFDVLAEALMTTKTDKKSLIKGTAQSARTSIMDEITANPDGLMFSGAFNSITGEAEYNYSIYYINYYNFLGKVLDTLEKDPKAVTSKLNKVRSKLSNSYGAIFGYTGDKEAIESFNTCSAKFADKLGNKKKTRAEYKTAKMYDAFMVNSGANFNYQVIDLKDIGKNKPLSYAEAAEYQVFATMLTDAYMLPYLRYYYGSYNASAELDPDLGIALTTYRDPNIAETKVVYDSLGDYLDSYKIDKTTLEGYIMSVYSSAVRSGGNLSEANTALSLKIEGKDYYTEKKSIFKALKKLTPKRMNEIKKSFVKVSKEGRFYSVGTSSEVKKNKDLYKDTIAPFGTGKKK